MSEIYKSSVDEQDVIGQRILSSPAQPRLRIEAHERDDETLFRAYSFVEFGQRQITDTFAEATEFDYTSPAHVAHGLRKVTYADTSLAQQIRRDTPELYPWLRHDSRQLAHVMQRSDGFEQIPAHIPVYNYSQAFFASNDMMRLLKRTNFIAFVHRCGYEVDEIAAHHNMPQLRYSAAHSHQRSGKYVKPHVIAAYLEYLREQEGPDVVDTLERAFFDMMFAALEREPADDEPRRFGDDSDGNEDIVYVRTDDLPPYVDAKHTQVSLSREPDAEKQRLAFIRPITPYVARPMLSWRTSADGIRTLHMDRTTPGYDIVDKVLYHRSQQLGMLSVHATYADLSTAELTKRAAQLTTRGPEFRRWIPSYTIGVTGVALAQAYATNGDLAAVLSERLALYEQAMQ
ncbi:MAG TPA: hypothetical protein VL362_02440 [Patescibacteria group bacterium]|jgi:hypothetical protein|nr:hypothetical protein [Patescibacteria group bacterium]